MNVTVWELALIERLTSRVPTKYVLVYLFIEKRKVKIDYVHIANKNHMECKILKLKINITFPYSRTN